MIKASGSVQKWYFLHVFHVPTRDSSERFLFRPEIAKGVDFIRDAFSGLIGRCGANASRVNVFQRLHGKFSEGKCGEGLKMIQMNNKVPGYVRCIGKSNSAPSSLGRAVWP
jgi:hypothetical protein